MNGPQAVVFLLVLAPFAAALVRQWWTRALEVEDERAAQRSRYGRALWRPQKGRSVR